MFTLPFHIPKNPTQIDLKDPVLLMGSCFADNIGNSLFRSKFDVLANPLGTIYNPYSIFKNLQSTITDGIDPDDIIRNGDVYYHWQTHSRISDTDREALKKQIVYHSGRISSFLKKSNWLIITLGTSYVYTYLPTEHVVANCHKIPQKQFKKSLLDEHEIVDLYQQMLKAIKEVNPSINIILSVSPVRHIRDGLVENNLSKSILIRAVHTICENNVEAHYFPAYELLIDVLRDYRYYADDMIHPSQQAVSFIWQRFLEAFFNDRTIDFVEKWQKINNALAHKPYHPHSESHQKFLRATIAKLENFQDLVDISGELQTLKNQLV